MEYPHTIPLGKSLPYIRGTVVTLDAMGCQTQVAQDINWLQGILLLSSLLLDFYFNAIALNPIALGSAS